jgi:hypothetical protein
MNRTKKVWLAIKRLIQIGWFTTIIADKCDSSWTDRECPRPATWKELRHRGQFGHKVVFLYCDRCLIKHDRRSQSSEFALLFYNFPYKTRTRIKMSDKPVEKQPKKPGFWSKVLAGLGTAFGQAKFGS